MTTPRHPIVGRLAGSQVRGDALARGAVAGALGSAWNVNSNYGNANINNRNNQGFVRPVRSCAPPAGECHGSRGRGADGAPSLRSLNDALLRARKQKKPSSSQLRFEQFWIDNLLDLQGRLTACTWVPSRTTCFVATRPKAREIHAPDFADRVVHHWLVPQLEAIYEPAFVADSFANRRGKGTHAAVDRLRTFVRQVHSGQGGGWYLQLDVHNFFNAIDRPTLWRLLKPRLQRAGLPMVAQRATHALLRQDLGTTGCRVRATAAELALVPAHKRLANAPAGVGLPIGNLSSQFFANVYLDQLDQFVKHTLRARRYLRYVDDFILVHHDRAQLQAWQTQIERFLAERLQLRLKADIRLRRLTDAVDFLGYVVYPTHTRVRQRVIRHATAALQDWQREHVRPGALVATPGQLRAVQASWASYQGHLRHAATHRLQARIGRQFPWLASAARPRRFAPALEVTTVRIPTHGKGRAIHPPAPEFY